MRLKEIRVSGRLPPDDYAEFKAVCQRLGLRRRDAVTLAVEAWVASMSIALRRQQKHARTRRRRDDVLDGLTTMTTLAGD